MKNAFYFVQKAFFLSQDTQIFVFLSSPLFFYDGHCFKGWSEISLKVYDVINCLNKNLITHFVWYLEKEKRYCRGYFRSDWTVAYQFWTYQIWAPRLGKLGEKIVKVSMNNSCKCFSFFSVPKKCTNLIWNLQHINRSFDSFYSQAVLAL